MTRRSSSSTASTTPPVVRDALAELPYECRRRAARRRHGEAARRARTTACRSSSARGRLRGRGGRRRPLGRAGARAARAPAARQPGARGGLRYVGADFRFEPPRFAPVRLPSLAVIGTGKRVGKTARDGAARAAARARPRRRRRRDGPRRAGGAGGGRAAADARACSSSRARAGTRPPTISRRPSLAGVVTIGCRRAGGGLAGAVACRTSWRARARGGARAGRRRLRRQRRRDPAGRRRRADPRQRARPRSARAVSTPTACSSPISSSSSAAAMLPRCGLSRTCRSSLRSCGSGRSRLCRGAGSRSSRPGPRRRDHLDADVVHVSRNLADRDALREELARTTPTSISSRSRRRRSTSSPKPRCERGAEVVLAANEVVSHPSSTRARPATRGDGSAAREPAPPLRAAAARRRPDRRTRRG